MDLDRIENWSQKLQAASPSEIKQIHQQIKPIMIGGSVADLIASPLFLKSESAERILRQTELFVQACSAIESHPDFKPGSRIYDRLYASLSIEGKNLIDRWLKSRSRPDAATIKKRFRRLDGFLADDLQIIEMNQSAPLAISFYERARQLNRQLAELVGDQEFQSLSLYEKMADWFLSYSNANKLTIAVSLEKGYPAKFIDLPEATQGIAAAALQKNRQIDFILAEPTDFKIANGKMLANDRKFDLLWRNTVYLQNYDVDISDYESIRYSNQMPQVNDLMSWLFRSKEFFAIIWDDQFISGLEAFGVRPHDLRAVCPHSYSLADMAKRSGENKDDYIVKRADDGFGRGIVFGHELNLREWRDFVQGKNGQDWIVQKIIDSSPIALPLINSKGQLISRSMILDCNPYFVDGSAGPLLARAMPHHSQAEKMNIVAGAAIGAYAW